MTIPTKNNTKADLFFGVIIHQTVVYVQIPIMVCILDLRMWAYRALNPKYSSKGNNACHFYLLKSFKATSHSLGTHQLYSLSQVILPWVFLCQYILPVAMVSQLVPG